LESEEVDTTTITLNVPQRSHSPANFMCDIMDCRSVSVIYWWFIDV